MVASVAVLSKIIKLYTRKVRWSDSPGLTDGKSCHVFWRQIWIECVRPRSGWVLEIMKLSKDSIKRW